MGRLRVSGFHEAALGAASSACVAVLPSFTAALHLAAGRLARVAPGLSFALVEVHLVLAPRHRGAAPLRALSELIRAALEAAEQGNGGTARGPLRRDGAPVVAGYLRTRTRLRIHGGGAMLPLLLAAPDAPGERGAPEGLFAVW